MTPALAVVPPMSKAMALSSLRAWHSARVPMTPAAGPDSSMRMQCDLRLLGLVEAAGRLHDEERADKSGGADAGVDLAQIAAHLRADIGVGDHRRAALEFPVFLRQLVRGGDEHVRVVRLDQRLGARLVVGIAIAVEEQDRDGLDAARASRATELPRVSASSSGTSTRRRRARARWPRSAAPAPPAARAS